MAVLLSLGCSSSSDPTGPAPRKRSTPAVAPTPAGGAAGDLVADTDARTLTDRMREGLLASGPERRRAAALALARLHDPAALPLLRDALRDTDPEVRRNAALGLGAFEDQAPPEAERILLGTLAAETVPANRAAMLWDLGRIAPDAGSTALREGLSDDAPEVRAGACRGLGALGLRGKTIDVATLGLLASRAADDAAVSTRIACAFALTRARPPSAEAAAASAGIARDLGRATRDADPDLREMATRAYARFDGATLERLAELASDPEWRVAVHAFRGLARRSTGATDGTLGRALRALTAQVVADPALLSGPRLHVVLAALDASASVAAGPSVFAAAEDAFARLGALGPGQDARSRGLAHCAAAKLVDLGRRWPSRLEHCGFGAVDATERSASMAEVVGAVQGADPQRFIYLQRLYRAGDVRVKEAVLGALPSVSDPGVLPLLAQALRATDAGILAAAADALGTLAPKLRAGPSAAAPSDGGTMDAGVPEDAGLARVPSPPLAEDVRVGMRACFRQLRATDELEGLISWVGAVEALGARELAPDLRQLRRHWNATLRAKVRTALEALGEPVVGADHAEVPNPIDLEDLAPPGSLPHVVVETSRGPVELELMPAEAPTTVARFLDLAARGYFDAKTFHRVVPAFVVQGGDPRGDGYGGPGWSQRCEDNRVQYVRGTVGMALAGRDTGGSQFFITHDVEPHLDGRYTAFGRVVRGMDVVDRLQVGDAIRRVRVSRETSDGVAGSINRSR